MTDIRRTILWVIFGFSMVMLWDQWQVYNGRQATFFPSAKTAPAAAAPAASAASGVPAALPTGAGSLPVVSAPSTSVPGVPAGPTAAQRERFTVSTDVLRVTFDSEGGSIVRTEFLQHTADDKKSPFVLLDQSAERVYVAQTGLVGGDFPTHKTIMTALPGDRALKDGAGELVVKFESPVQGGVKLLKTYTFKRGAYDVPVRHEVVNTGAAAVAPQLYMQLVRDGNSLPGESSFYSTFTGPAVYTEAQKFQKIDFKDIEK
ncbi:MAG TPA: membrane protein insertase YidC, partial [Ramlibacter sp.]